MKSAILNIYLILLMAGSLLAAGCTGSSSPSAVDSTFGGSSSTATLPPILSSVPNLIAHQTQALNVDVNNVSGGAPGNDNGMTYSCYWDQVVDGTVASTNACSTLPGTAASFSPSTGVLNWTPSTAELGMYEVRITGQNSVGSAQVVFSVSVRLQFSGITSITGIQGSQMTLNWTPNLNATSYQILQQQVGGLFTVYQTVASPSASSVTLTGLTPLQSYTWEVQAIDSYGNQDANSISMTAITTDVIHVAVTLGAGATSATIHSGNSVTATATLTYQGSVLTTGTYTVNFSMSGGTSTASVGSVTTVSSGIYTVPLAGLVAGTATTVTATVSSTYLVDSTAALTVIPGTVASAATSTLTTASTTVASGSGVVVTGTARDAAGNAISGLSSVTFSNTTGSGISTGSFGATTDNGDGTYSATFTGTLVGTATTVSMYSAGLQIGGTVSETVTPGTPSKLTVTGPSSFSADSCSSAFKLSFFDAAGNAATLSSATTFTFGGAGNGQFYSDSGTCASSLSSLSVASGSSTSQNFYFKSFDATTYAVSFSASGLTQSPATYGFTVTPVLTWIGAVGTMDTLGTNSNFFSSGIFDGSYSQPYTASYGLVGGNPYLFVSDFSNHRVQKLSIGSGAALTNIGSIGRIGSTDKSIPTGGTNSAYCSTLAVGVGVNGAWCTGGQFQLGSGDGLFNAPYRTTVMNISGTDYLFVVDDGNHRIVKYNASTGAYIGWTGRILTTTGMTGSCLAAGIGATTPSGWCTGGTSQVSTTPVSGSASGGTSTGGNQFSSPNFITNDGTYLYVNDAGNNRFVQVDPTTGLVVHWIGRISSVGFGGADGTASPTAISCLTNTHADGTSTLTAGQWTPSWCTGGGGVGTILAQGSFTSSILNPQTSSSARGLAIYSDGTYNWLIIMDGNSGRFNRYFCGVSTSTPNCSSTSAVNIGGTNYYPGQFFGWAGLVNTVSANAGTVPASISSLFNNTSGSSTATFSNGWAFYGNSAITGSVSGMNGALGIVISGGYMYVAGGGNFRVDKFSMTGATSGRFVGWIGRVGTTPTGGVSGCAGTVPGNATPGWCTGGIQTGGSSLGGFVTPSDVDTDGTYLWVTDRDNYRVVTYNLSTGAAIGAMGLHVSTQPSGWALGPMPASTSPANTTSNSTVVNRDTLFAAPDHTYIQGNYMYVTDKTNNRLKRYTWLDGQFQGWSGLTSGSSPTGGDSACIGALTGGFTPGWCQGGGFAASTTFGYNTPRGMASDGTYIYVADQTNNRIVRERLSDGAFMGWIGQIATSPSDGDSGCAGAGVGTITPGWCVGGTSASSTLLGGFNSPVGLAGFTDTDTHYYLIVGDIGNNRLQKIDVTNIAGATWVGKNGSGSTICGYASGTMVLGWCGTAAAASSSDTTGFVNNGYISGANGIYVDTSSSPAYIYAATNSRILRFNASTGLFKGWVGSFSTVITAASCESGTAVANTGTPSWCYGGNVGNGTGDGQFTSSAGVYSDGTYVYASDSYRILRYTVGGIYSGWKGKVDSASGLGGTGCTSLSTNSITPNWCTGGTAKGGFDLDATANAAALDGPRGIYGRGNYLYITDTNNGRVLTIPK